MIIATIAFVVFLIAVVSGVIWMVKQDTNFPETEWTLRLQRINRRVKTQMLPAFAEMQKSFKDVEKSFAKFNEAFRRSQKKHGVR